VRYLLLFAAIVGVAGAAGAFFLPGTIANALPPQAAAQALPPDVNPDSRNRLPQVRRENLNAEGQKIFDAIGNTGPTGVRIHNPVFASHMNQANDYLRTKSGLDPRLAEMVILVGARAVNGQYIWTAHEPSARDAGLEPAIIEIIKHRRPLTGVGEREAALIRLGREALGDEHKVSPATFAAAAKFFNPHDLVSYVSLMLHYASSGTLLNTFDQQLRPGQTPLLPVP
jgi:4-carboxymuconolactone decarboxylase